METGKQYIDKYIAFLKVLEKMAMLICIAKKQQQIRIII